MKNQRNDRYFIWDDDEEPEPIDVTNILFAVCFIMQALGLLIIQLR